MKFNSFTIKNFKGIESCKLDIQGSRNQIITLIGLNESGKTTVLEAIAGFGEDTELLAVTKSRPPVQVKDNIPKHRRANFTDEIEIGALITFEDEDKKALSRFFKSKYQMDLNLNVLPGTFEVTRSTTFKDSEPVSAKNIWSLTFKARKPPQRKYLTISAFCNKEVWLDAVRFVSSRLPRICYFPTFLFEIPEKIYLEASGNGEDNTKYYRRILQDVLDAQGEKLSLKTHIVDRVAKSRVVSPTTGTAGHSVIAADARENIDHVFRKLSTELNRVIFGAWNEVFDKKPRHKKIDVRWDVDRDRGNSVYCQIKIADGEELYALSERSLGFRWFFCFLLFTQFGAFRGEGRKTIFLLDEPASNLHSSAQLKLLASFPRISGESNTIIYTTHSHYMIEPLWLDQAFIVVNKAVDYEQDELDADHFSNQPTNITVQKYRDFAAQHSERSTYFQPVLDRLDYIVSPLVGHRNALIVEGKQDYYAMKFLLPALGCIDIDIVPGAGSGNMETLISLFLGWGRHFLILFDDDKAGQKEKRRYADEYCLPGVRLATYGDISNEFKGKELEQLFGPELKIRVAEKLELNRDPKKKDFARYFQELLATGASYDSARLDSATCANILIVVAFVSERLSANTTV